MIGGIQDFFFGMVLNKVGYVVFKIKSNIEGYKCFLNVVNVNYLMDIVVI